MNEYLFKEKCLKEEISFVLNKTKPIYVKTLPYLRTESDFNLGEFAFYMKGKNEHCFKIPFYNDTLTLNNFWKFLELVTYEKEPLVLDVFHAGEEVVLYVEMVNKNDIRFCVFNTIKIAKSAKNNEYVKCSYKEAEIDIDIIITKRRFVKQFYKILRNLFETQDAISYFEPPFIDYNFWIKDSEKIKKFLKIHKKGA